MDATALPDRDSPTLSLRGVGRRYGQAAQACDALAGVDLDVRAGEFVALLGASGSGKSTLLNLVAGLDRPTSGSVVVAGRALEKLSWRALAKWRGTGVGLVFQFFQLLPTLTAIENVMLPMDFARRGAADERRRRAEALLERLGVADQAHKLPATLSGGQQQRVAVARALANDPPLLLADEPTGNLDSRNAASLVALLRGLASDGRTVVMATHDAAARAHASRAVTLVDGRVVSDEAVVRG